MRHVLLLALLGLPGCKCSTPPAPSSPDASVADASVDDAFVAARVALSPKHVNPQGPSYYGWTGVDGGNVLFSGAFDGGAGPWPGEDGQAYTFARGDQDPCLPDVLTDAGVQLPFYTVTREDGGNVCADEDYSTGRPGACESQGDNAARYLGKGFVLEGCWNPDGSWSRTGSDGQPCFSVSCTTGAAGICAHWGYIPGASWKGGPELERLYQACVRAARADYGGTGDTFTCKGTYVDFVDGYGIQTQDVIGKEAGLPPLQFEAAWDERGAVPLGVAADGGGNCVRPRYANTSLASLDKELPAPLGAKPLVASTACVQPGNAATPLSQYFDGGVPFLLLTQTWSNTSCGSKVGPDDHMGCPPPCKRGHHSYAPVTCDGGCVP